MLDVGQAGLFSSTEPKAFQNKFCQVWGPLLDENISEWKKILSKKSFRRKTRFARTDEDPAVIIDGKFIRGISGDFRGKINGTLGV